MAISSDPTLEHFMQELAADLAEIPGIVFAPRHPPEKIAVFPCAVPYNVTGRIVHAPQNLITYLHTVQIAVLTARKDSDKDNEIIIPFLEKVTEKIFLRLSINGTMYSDLETIGDADESASYVYTALPWGGQDYLGYLITLNNVKIQRDL